MTPREETIQRAKELFSIFKYERFTLREMKKNAPSFNYKELSYMRMFGIVQTCSCGRNTRSVMFLKDPNAIPL